MEMLQLKSLHKTFNPGTVNEKVAPERCRLHLDAGDFATIVGSNGAGKSTLFNAITGGFYRRRGQHLLGGQGHHLMRRAPAQQGHRASVSGPARAPRRT